MTGPIKPPFQHPEWQGSVPAHWMDRGTGYQRGKPLHNCDVRDGYNGIARRGFGPFSIDAPFRLYEESQRRTKQFPEAETRIAPWGDHPAEFRWKPSRRKLEDHEFDWRVGPQTMHSGLLAHVSEPDLLSKRPPFVDKGPLGKTQPVYDGVMERSIAKLAERRLSKSRRAAIAEERWERTQVLDLERWERSHVNPPRSRSMSKLSLGSPMLSTTLSNATMLGGTMPSAMLGGTMPSTAMSSSGALPDVTASRTMPRRGQSESALQFSNQR